MTDATLAGRLPTRPGLTETIARRDYDAWMADAALTPILAIIRLDVLDTRNDEQRDLLLEELFAWAENSEVDLVQRWWERHDRQFVPDPRSASLALLRSFAIDERVFAGSADEPGDLDGAGRVPGGGDAAAETAGDASVGALTKGAAAPATAGEAR